MAYKNHTIENTVESTIESTVENTYIKYIDPYPATASPELYIHLGWNDIQATQEHLLAIKKGYLQNLMVFIENIKAVCSSDLIPNIFYRIGVEDAIDYIQRDGLLTGNSSTAGVLAIPKFENFTSACIWHPPFDEEQCDECHEVFSTLLYIDSGPIFNRLACSKECIQRMLDSYNKEEDTLVRLLVNGQLRRRELFLLNKSKAELVEIFSSLPLRTNLLKPSQEKPTSFNLF